MSTLHTFNSMMKALPALSGTGEQRVWATRIRESIVDELRACWDFFISDVRYTVSEGAAKHRQHAVYQAASTVLARYTSATWWIYYFQDPDNDRGMEFTLRNDVFTNAERIERNELPTWQDLSTFDMLVLNAETLGLRSCDDRIAPDGMQARRFVVRELQQCVPQTPSLMLLCTSCPSGIQENESEERVQSEIEQVALQHVGMSSCLGSLCPPPLPEQEHQLTFEILHARRDTARKLVEALTGQGFDPKRTVMIGDCEANEEIAFLAQTHFAWAHGFFGWLADRPCSSQSVEILMAKETTQTHISNETHTNNM